MTGTRVRSVSGESIDKKLEYDGEKKRLQVLLAYHMLQIDFYRHPSIKLEVNQFQMPIKLVKKAPDLYNYSR
jgi:hypothetical protein